MNKKKLFDRIFLIKKKFGQKENYFYLKVPKASIIIPIYKKKFLVVSQKRIPLNKVTYEFPGGLVDRGNNAEKTALIELEEETGFKAIDRPKKILELFPDAGRLDSTYECFFVNKLTKVGKPERGIKLHFYNKKKILSLIKRKKFSHACHISAFLFLIIQNKYLSDK